MAWGKMGSLTATGSTAGQTLSSLSDNKFIQIMAHQIPNASGNVNSLLTFNGDVGSNQYQNRYNDNGTVNDPTPFQYTSMVIASADSVFNRFEVIYVLNIAGEEKLMIGSAVNGEGANATSPPIRTERASKWRNTADVISSIKIAPASNNYVDGTNISVLGSDLTQVAAIPFPTNVQLGSRAEITDTRKMYHYESGSPTDLDAVTWTNSPTGSTWGQSNNEITFANMTGSTEVMYYDVGTANISDTKWVLRFKLDIDTWSQGTSGSSDWVIFGLSSTAGNSDTSQDSMVGVIRNNSSSQSLAITRTNGTTINSQLGSTDLEVLGATGSFYVEMIRTSDANYTLNVRSGSHSGTLLGSQNYTDASGVGGLRYIKAMNHLTSNTNADASGSFGEIEFYNGVVTAVLPSEWKEEGT